MKRNPWDLTDTPRGAIEEAICALLTGGVVVAIVLRMIWASGVGR